MEKFSHRIRVRYAETDKMGVVHHSVYPVYMEEARVAYLDYLGLPYHRLEEMGVLLPVLEVSVSFRKPLRFGDEFVVELESSWKGLRLIIDYTFLKRGEVIAVARSVHVPTDGELRVLRRLPAGVGRLLHFPFIISREDEGQGS